MGPGHQGLFTYPCVTNLPTLKYPKRCGVQGELTYPKVPTHLPHPYKSQVPTLESESPTLKFQVPTLKNGIGLAHTSPKVLPLRNRSRVRVAALPLARVSVPCASCRGLVFLTYKFQPPALKVCPHRVFREPFSRLKISQFFLVP
jgi:hypothetical protein